MSIHIDSSEVLHHLNCYGIDSIDDKSLKCFMKDLKKLIKYEHYKNMYDAESEQNIPTENKFPCSKEDPTLLHKSDNRRKKSCCRKNLKENIRLVYSEESPKNNRIHYQEINKCEYPCKNVQSRLSTQRSEIPDKINAQKSSCSCKHRVTVHNDDKPNTDRLPEDASNITRPTSLLSCTRSQAPSIRNKKGHCDPVQLYHYYQSFWKNHKLPGENDHAQLRLAIRKRLMNAK